jgi:hypothetical protein
VYFTAIATNVAAAVVLPNVLWEWNQKKKAQPLVPSRSPSGNRAVFQSVLAENRARPIPHLTEKNHINECRVLRQAHEIALDDLGEARRQLSVAANHVHERVELDGDLQRA